MAFQSPSENTMELPSW